MLYNYYKHYLYINGQHQRREFNTQGYVSKYILFTGWEILHWKNIFLTYREENIFSIRIDPNGKYRAYFYVRCLLKFMKIPALRLLTINMRSMKFAIII